MSSLQHAQRHAQRLARAVSLSTALRCDASVPGGGIFTPEAVAARLAPDGAGCASSGQQQHATGFHRSRSAWLQGSSARSFASGPADAAAESAAAGSEPAAGGGDAAAAQYTQIGRITGKYQVPRKLAFAVVEVGPTQFKVSQGDTIVTEKLRGVDVNDKISLNRVLMLGSRHETIIGRPFVPEAFVTAAVEEQFQDGKVLIFKKRRRKHSRRLNGHRQELTTLRIMEVAGIEAEAPPLEGKKPAWWEGRRQKPDVAVVAV